MSARVFMHSKSSLWWEQTPAILPKSKAGAVILKNLLIWAQLFSILCNYFNFQHQLFL